MTGAEAPLGREGASSEPAASNYHRPTPAQDTTESFHSYKISLQDRCAADPVTPLSVNAFLGDDPAFVEIFARDERSREAATDFRPQTIRPRGTLEYVPPRVGQDR